MPELPEVETVRQGLLPALLGNRILRVDQRRPDLRFPIPENFVSRLEGSRVTGIDRRGKYLLIRLEDGWSWVVHLGMSGRFTVGGGGRASSAQAGHNSGWALVEPHDHVLIDIEGGYRLVYNDTRRFGFMDLIEPGGEDQSTHFSRMGPEPLSEAFNFTSLNNVLKGRKTPIKNALLDQSVVAGLGNIYVCEALWRASISPKRLAASIPGKRSQRLVPIIKAVLADAIKAGGSTLRDYVHADGELGYFQHSFDAYDREGEPCTKPDCDGAIRRIVQSGRSTFYCPVHQR